MANTIIASSSKTLIKSPPAPKPKQPSFSIPQFPLIPTTKHIQFPSLSTKLSIAIAAASLAAASTPLPALAAEIEEAASGFDLQFVLSVADILFLLVLIVKALF